MTYLPMSYVIAPRLLCVLPPICVPHVRHTRLAWSTLWDISSTLQDTADHTAHYGAGGREWDTGDGGSDVTALPGLSPNVSNYLSNGAHSVCTTSEEGGLILA